MLIRGVPWHHPLLTYSKDSVVGYIHENKAVFSLYGLVKLASLTY